MTYSKLFNPLPAYISLSHSPFFSSRVVPRTLKPRSSKYSVIQLAMKPLAPVTKTGRRQHAIGLEARLNLPKDPSAGTGMIDDDGTVYKDGVSHAQIGLRGTLTQCRWSMWSAALGSGSSGCSARCWVWAGGQPRHMLVSRVTLPSDLQGVPRAKRGV